MNNLLVLDLYNEILKTLMDIRQVSNSPSIQNIIKRHVEDDYFKIKINIMLARGDFSCKGVFSLCHNMMDDLGQHNIPEDWLNYVYQFALNKSFPQAVIIQLSGSLDLPCLVYLQVLRIFSNYQKLSSDETWQSKYPVLFLSEDEENELENPSEYKRFLKAFDEDYIYEMMKLNQEIMGHNTLDHICGVHFLAIHIGRELKALGLPVDLGRVSGSSAGHDIGKYGCKTTEYKRVPYLHYYYTDQWFKKHDITYIGHIAVNHSTWDLELENLPLESLIMIYADFRVKNRYTVDKKTEMYIFNLKESFEVILNKLDNVDETKEKRYKRVYSKLKDFEEYMVSLGVKVELDSPAFSPETEQSKSSYSLMQGQDIIDNIKYLSIKHNINLMHELRDEFTLNVILESARSESDWKKLREYIRIFEEYSTYLTQKQKLITIKFLYDQLIHPEDDIRRHSAELIGILIATFDEDYRKEVPQDVSLGQPSMTSCQLLEKYLKLFIIPDHKIVSLHRTWIGYSISLMIASLFSHCRPSLVREYRDILLKYYSSDMYKTNEIKLYLIETIKFIPQLAEGDTCKVVFEYIIDMLQKRNNTLRLSTLEIVNGILPRVQENKYFIGELSSLFARSPSPAELATENLLNYKIVAQLGVGNDVLEEYLGYYKRDLKKVPDIFLSNLKSGTDWVLKKNQIDFLVDYALRRPGSNGLYTAMHLCNILKVSAVESVRNRAGEALLDIIPHLSHEQRNDVAVELLRALEIEGYQFAEYIPHYLGQVILYLPPIELDEFIDDSIEKIKQSGTQLNSLILKTIGVALVSYEKYIDRFNESSIVYNNRLLKLIGIILNGLVHYNLHVKQVAFSVLGKDIFGSKLLKLEQKHHILQLTAKKILTLMTDEGNEELLFLTNSAALNHIYRFISDYTFQNGIINLKKPDRIAFFPGTFDPFSLSHKEIAKEIRGMGFEVYLNADEFSWSKRTLPNRIRQNIISMSIADELDIYLYPEQFPTNLANPEDLKILKDNFSNSEVYIVVGSDVIVNASAYKSEKVENSIHTFSHIIFERKNNNSVNNTDTTLEEAVTKIEGKIIRLALEPQYEDISSTQIRGYIDENRDISMLVDPLVQKYIYENGFYQSEPQYKSPIQTISIDIEVIESINHDLIEELSSILYKNYEEVFSNLTDFLDRRSRRLLLIRDTNRKGKIIGFSAFHHITSSTLYYEFKNSTVTEYIRKNSVGKTVVIDGIFVRGKSSFENLEQILLSETLAFCLDRDYDYAVFHCIVPEYPMESVIDTMKLQGFTSIPGMDEHDPVYAVNMSTPCTLDLNMESTIKEPYRSNPQVKQVIMKCRRRLQEALTKLYPGHLVIAFDRNVMYETLVKKICKENEVPTMTLSPRKLGPSMCVPYGNILNKTTVPNTVTKALHTEKMFAPDMESHKIGPFPYYLDLDIQIKMLRSFNRPIILVDDLLDKGYRIKALDPLLKKENLSVQKIIVGILSGRGRELMEIQGWEVDSAYFIPKLKIWFNENAFYPFIGGNALWREVIPKRNLLPSINLILPYTSPSFMKDAPKESVYQLSEVSLENSIEILTVLEDEYQLEHERTLTLNLLGQVFATPRCPEHGKNMDFDLNLSPSHFLKNDLELLRRLKNIIL